MKGQAGAEFVFVLSLVVALSVFLISTGFKEMELNMALTAARTSAEKIAVENGVSLLQLDYVVTGGAVTVTPSFSQDWIPTAELQQRLCDETRAVVSPNSEEDCPDIHGTKTYHFTFS